MLASTSFMGFSKSINLKSSSKENSITGFSLCFNMYFISMDYRLALIFPSAKWRGFIP